MIMLYLLRKLSDLEFTYLPLSCCTHHFFVDWIFPLKKKWCDILAFNSLSSSAKRITYSQHFWPREAVCEPESFSSVALSLTYYVN